MSLKSKYKDPFVALKDIECYKIIGVSEDSIVSPFKVGQCTIDGDAIYLDGEVDDRMLYDENEEVYLVSKQGIHVTSTLNDAKLLLCSTIFNSERTTFTRNGVEYQYKIVKCVIPKGTMYWKGTYKVHETDKIKFSVSYYDIDSMCARKIQITDEDLHIHTLS